MGEFSVPCLGLRRCLVHQGCGSRRAHYYLATMAPQKMMTAPIVRYLTPASTGYGTTDTGLRRMCFFSTYKPGRVLKYGCTTTRN